MVTWSEMNVSGKFSSNKSFRKTYFWNFPGKVISKVSHFLRPTTYYSIRWFPSFRDTPNICTFRHDIHQPLFHSMMQFSYQHQPFLHSTTSFIQRHAHLSSSHFILPIQSRNTSLRESSSVCCRWLMICKHMCYLHCISIPARSN